MNRFTDTAEGGNTVTLAEVAKHAGVSVGSTSRVLNGHPKVSNEIRSAVERAMKDLGYVPNTIARSLRKAGARNQIWTGQVGFVFVDASQKMLEQSYIARMVLNIQQGLSEGGYSLTLGNTADSVHVPAILREGKVEGCIFHGRISPELIEQARTLSHILVIGSSSMGFPVSTVNVDNAGGIIAAMRYLKSLRHERIAFVNCDPDHEDFIERLNGYRAGLKLLGLEADPRWEAVASKPRRRSDDIVVPETTPPHMDHLIVPLMQAANRPTAILVANDWQAIGVYRALEKLGISIPGDLSVIGFDNDSRVCGALHPHLTSIEYPSEKIGLTAARVLSNLISGKGDGEQHITIKPLVIERNSCAEV